MIKVFDRIKEFSITPGTGLLQLQGAAFGYSSFASVYSSGDVCYYAAVCDNVYEVGSGVFLSDGNEHFLSRNVIVSTNNNAPVDFPSVTKEIFVSYPANFSVFSDKETTPGELAIWSGQNTLDSSSISWDGSRLTVLGDIYPSGGVFLPQNVPPSTSNKLYNSNGQLFFNGQALGTSSFFPYTNASGSYSPSFSDHVIFLDPSFNDVNINLPSASGVGGKEFILKRKPGNYKIFINATSGEYVDGQLEFILTHDYESVSLISDNANWFIF